MASIKGPGEAQTYDGSSLRIGIVHARWNTSIIDTLVAGTRKSLTAAGVKEENIVIQSVPGSYELPYAVQRMYASSQIQSSASGVGGGLLASATDLLTSTSSTDLSPTATAKATPSAASSGASTAPFDAIVAIGCLIKGETMHFEYIAESVSHALMRVQLDSQIPVIFGLLTVLNEEQGLQRAGVKPGMHNHGEDWGSAAVELAVKKNGWADGKFVQ